MQKVWRQMTGVLRRGFGLFVVMELTRREKFVIVEQFQLVLNNVVHHLVQRLEHLAHCKTMLMNVVQVEVKYD